MHVCNSDKRMSFLFVRTSLLLILFLQILIAFASHTLRRSQILEFFIGQGSSWFIMRIIILQLRMKQYWDCCWRKTILTHTHTHWGGSRCTRKITFCAITPMISTPMIVQQIKCFLWQITAAFIIDCRFILFSVTYMRVMSSVSVVPQHIRTHEIEIGKSICVVHTSQSIKHYTVNGKWECRSL